MIQGGALAAQAFDEAEAPVASTSTPAVIDRPMAAAPVVDAPVRSEAVTETPAEPMPQVAQAAPAAPMPVTAPVAAAPAPVAAAPAPVAAPAAAFVLPLDSLQAVAESAGLQWVNSDAGKIRAVQAAMAAEPAALHVPRERKAAAVVDEGPLVLVETRKDLSQIKLPFEQAQGSQPQG